MGSFNPSPFVFSTPRTLTVVLDHLGGSMGGAGGSPLGGNGVGGSGGVEDANLRRIRSTLAHEWLRYVRVVGCCFAGTIGA